jgi:hypothetical protein
MDFLLSVVAVGLLFLVMSVLKLNHNTLRKYFVCRFVIMMVKKPAEEAEKRPEDLKPTTKSGKKKSQSGKQVVQPKLIVEAGSKSQAGDKKLSEKKSNAGPKSGYQCDSIKFVFFLVDKNLGAKKEASKGKQITVITLQH